MVNHSRSAKKSRFWRVALWLSVSLAAVGLVVLVLFAFSAVQGEELSPDDFSRRSFRYRQIPWTNYAFTRVKYRELDNSMAQFLVDQKWLPPSNNGGDKRWDLIRDNKTSKLSHDCDARFLEPFVASSTFGGQPKWLKWSTKHPTLAPILWSSVAQLARNNVYWAIPSLMREAIRLESLSPTEFQSAISDFLATRFVEDGIDKMIGRNYQQAIESYTTSIEIKPTAEAYSRRSKAHDELDQAESSKSDRMSAANLEEK